MVLVDTSVRVEHFRKGNTALTAHLVEGRVLMHPFVSGELACGDLKDRSAILADLHALTSSQARVER